MSMWASKSSTCHCGSAQPALLYIEALVSASTSNLTNWLVCTSAEQQKLTITCDKHTFNFLRREQFVFLCVAVSTARLAGSGSAKACDYNSSN